MKITLKINYQTYDRPERMYFCPVVRTKFFGEDQEAFQMDNKGDGNWELSKESSQYLTHLQYFYEVRDTEGNLIRKEWGHPHELDIYGSAKNVEIQNFWHDVPLSLPFQASPFTRMFFKRQPDTLSDVQPKNSYLLLRVLAPFVRSEEDLVICGEGETLGKWDTRKAPVMRGNAFPMWEITIPLSEVQHGEKYKFAVVKKETKEVVYWEEGEDRVLNLKEASQRDAIFIVGMQFRRSSHDWKVAGVAIPVFSLRSKRSAGIGDFGDLSLLVDWASACGMKIVQMLPINDTTLDHTWSDSYPYRTTSVYALHPIYLAMEDMGILEDEEKMQSFRKEWERLNHLPDLDYEAVDRSKWEYFRELYKQEEISLWKDIDFQNFVKDNLKWLRPYAVFSALRDRHRTSNFREWGKESSFSRQLLDLYFPLNKPISREVGIYVFLQYHLYKQLSKARAYAHQKGIIFKGDLPIGIGRDSVEAWVEPKLFHTNCQAGAPPDAFSTTGQNWGFPTYNWEEMYKDGLSWWKGRFAMMGKCFDAFRIDHILGFFRIWEIPSHSVEGLLGYFNPALPYTKEEIEARGFSFDEKYTRPFITTETIATLFGEETEFVKQTFLNQRSGEDFYTLKPTYNSQRLIEQSFRNFSTPRFEKIKGGLYALCNEVLFVPDPYKKGCYHPRISACDTLVFRSLTEEQKNAYTNLYNEFYFSRHNDFWRDEALEKLPQLLSSVEMLPCAEDLGMIPASVPDVLKALRISSLEVERMPKMGNVGDTHFYPYYSVCTTGTHDMSTLRQWWKEDKTQTQDYYNRVLHHQGNAPEECSPELCREIIEHILNAPSMLAILPWQDWLSVDGLMRKTNDSGERINIPSNVAHHWKWRMHLFLEDLIDAKDFNNTILTLIKHNNR